MTRFCLSTKISWSSSIYGMLLELPRTPVSRLIHYVASGNRVSQNKLQYLQSKTSEEMVQNYNIENHVVTYVFSTC